jgi:hypothetical protein
LPQQKWKKLKTDMLAKALTKYKFDTVFAIKENKESCINRGKNLILKCVKI